MSMTNPMQLIGIRGTGCKGLRPCWDGLCQQRVVAGTQFRDHFRQTMRLWSSGRMALELIVEKAKNRRFATLRRGAKTRVTQELVHT